ncbi:MAG: hypothetical protein K2Y27_16790 [Xanthobacteraceae bacterium]|nr:hypothetical protein [Xanthobacteraceae bacterium]
MPHRRRPPASDAAAAVCAAPEQSFRQRFENLEARREALLARLTTMGDATKQHPGHRRALTLLNASFRRASVAQRAAVLQAAEWLIELLERVTSLV